MLSQLVGQPKAVNLLRRALAGRRLAHGYLFAGPEGVGKRTAAHALAAQLLCQNAERKNPPCGLCPGCRKFAAGTHPDFLVIKPDGASIKINQIRELKKALSFPPIEPGMRFAVIEEAQNMGREAGNSLLKILEEPPPDNLLLLVASDAEPLLETIVSRCQVIPFAPLTEEQTAQIIRRNHPLLEPETVQTLVRLTGGCPGQADSLLNSDALSLHKECLQMLLNGRLSRAEAVEQALALADQMAELKDECGQLLDLLALFFKEVMTALLCRREPAEEEHALAAARERWNLPQLSAMVDAVDSARSALARNCSRTLVCEVLLLELIAQNGG